MVARPGEKSSFIPEVRAKLAISPDGTLAAVHEPTRIVVVTVATGAIGGEIGIDPDAGASEVAWLGPNPRLLVLSRFASHSSVHLVDPAGTAGPRTVAEIRLEAPMRLAAVVGMHALAVGPSSAAVLTAGDASLLPYQFPVRSVPSVAGAAGAQFVVALTGAAGAIEEWDPASRMPRRRLRLPRPALIKLLGGSDRVVWLTTQSDPTRIDVIPLINRGQAKHHDLPEPIAQIASHPRSDLLACLGADSGRVYLLDLDGKAAPRVLAMPGIDRAEAVGLAIGRGPAVIATQARRPLAIVALDPSREATVVEVTRPSVEVRLPEGSSLGEQVMSGLGALAAEAPAEPSVPSPSSLVAAPVAPAPPVTPVAPPVAPVASVASSSGGPVPWATVIPTAPAPTAKAAVTAVTGQELGQRFSAWRERMRQAQPRGEEHAATAPFVEHRPTWRDDLVSWTRAALAGTLERVVPSAPALDAMLARLELPAALAPALALLYGAHLVGERGVAPADLARVAGRRWDEALGRGLLVGQGAATCRGSRVRLASAVRRVLDELPPRRGEVIGELGGQVALLGPCAIVGGGAPLRELAEAALATVGGAILAGADGVDFAKVFAEARALGVAPMIRVTAATFEELPVVPAILVVSDEATAESIGIPRLG